jgi:hypothetical protein
VKALEILLRAREKPAEDPWQIRKEQGPRGIDLGERARAGAHAPV